MGTDSIQPDHTVAYPLGSDEKAGCLMLFGNPERADKLAILCAGFPNDHACFYPLASRLAKEANCLAGVMCIPGYDDRSPERPWTSHPKNGYTFDEWVHALREAILALRQYSNDPKNQQPQQPRPQLLLTGIFHDWGVIPGLMHTNRVLLQTPTTTTTSDGDSSTNHDPARLDQLVLLDVLVDPHPNHPGLHDIIVPKQPSLFRQVYKTVTTLAYRILLAKVYVTQRYISKHVALLQFGFGFGLLGLLGLSPGRAMDDKIVQDLHLNPFRVMYMAYPYYGLIKSRVWGTFQRDFYGCHLPLDLKATPVLYMYGLNKNIMFHPDRAVALLEQANPRGKVIAMEQAGHWLYISQPELCFQAIQEFITSQK
ncbi:hypothetical protein ACA910_018007 [Epithemia clementina (nom. ined.)]